MSPAGGRRQRRDSLIGIARIARYLSGLVGLAIVGYLIADVGGRKVAEAMLVIGWGLVPVTLFHLLPMFVSTLSWRELLPVGRRPGLAALAWVRWIRESINSLLPVGQVGGDLVGIRLVYLRGTPAAPATASMVVDVTVGVFTQLGFVALGLGLLLLRSTEPAVLAIVWLVFAGLVVLLVAIMAFFLLQRRGLFGLTARIAGGLVKTAAITRLVGKAGDVDVAVRAVYGDRRAFWRAMGWRLIGWAVGTGEIWLLMYFLGKPVSLAEAFILESLGAGVRAAAFVVPGALGVLEGSYVVFAGLFGIAPGDALVIALGKRVRELALGIPGLIAWQAAGLAGSSPGRAPRKV